METIYNKMDATHHNFTTNLHTTLIPTATSLTTKYVDPIVARVNATVSLLLVLVVLVGNFFIILIFKNFKKVRDLNNIAVTMLSICDLLRGTLVMLPKIYNQYTLATTYIEPFCTMSALSSAFTFVFNPQLLALIAVFRYRKINPEVQTSFNTSHKNFYIAAAVICVDSIAFALLPILGVGKYEYSISHGVCFTDWSVQNRVFRTIFYVIVIGLAFPILTACYSLLFMVLRKHRNSILSKYQHEKEEIDGQNKIVTFFKRKISKDQSRTKSGISMEVNVPSTNRTSVNDTPDVKKKEIQEETRSNESNVSSSDLTDSRKEKKREKDKVKKQLSKQEYQVTKLMIFIFLAYCICWIPAAVLNIVALINTALVPTIWMYVIVTMVELKSALNPLIYGLGNRKYRRAFRKIVKKYWPLQEN